MLEFNPPGFSADLAEQSDADGFLVQTVGGPRLPFTEGLIIVGKICIAEIHQQGILPVRGSQKDIAVQAARAVIREVCLQEFAEETFCSPQLFGFIEVMKVVAQRDKPAEDLQMMQYSAWAQLLRGTETLPAGELREQPPGLRAP
jgi:hypothetical protein